MSTDASNAPPSASANPTPTSKEKPMASTTPSSEVSAVVGSSASTESKPAVTGEEVNKEKNVIEAATAPAPGGETTPAPDTKKPRKHGVPYDPRSLLADAEKDLLRAAAVDDPLVKADRKLVVEAMAQLNTAKGDHRVALSSLDASEAALEPFKPPVAQAVTPVKATLLALNGTGRELYLQVRSPDPLQTAQSLLAGMRQGTLGVEPALIHRLAGLLKQAAPALKEREQASARLASAEDGYRTARDQLETSLSALRNSLAIHVASGRRAERLATRKMRGARRG